MIGADTKQFLSYQEVGVTVLDKSWRLKENILNLSKKVSSKITVGKEKIISPVAEGGNIFYFNDLEEVPINNEESYYFLSRNRYFLKQYEEHLQKLGLI